MDKEERAASRVGFLTLHQQFTLDWVCENLVEAFGNVAYLVGSVLKTPDFRDVDVRMMLDDEKFKTMFPNEYVHKFFNAAVSEWMSNRTGLPIDFQFQDHTEANKKHGGVRNPLGLVAIHNKDKPPSVGG